MTAPVAATLVLGDDPYLVSEAVAKALAGLDPLSVEELHAGDDRERLLGALEATSLFGGRRGVVVRGLEDAPAEVARSLATYLKDPNPDCLLVVVGTKAAPALSEAVRKVGRVVEAGRGRRNDVFAWLRDKARGTGLKMSADAMGALIEAVGEERMALAQALSELSLALGANAAVGPDDVARQFGARSAANLFAFLDAAVTGQTGAALVALRRLIDRGESAQGLFGALIRHVRLMIEVGDLPAGAAARELNLNPFRAEKIVKQASGYPPAALAQAYRALAAADAGYKRGDEGDELALERAVITVSGLRRPAAKRA